MNKYLFIFFMSSFLSGCFSSGSKWLSPDLRPVPSLKEFSDADLNKDNVIDINESVAFASSQKSPEYLTPLIVISSIIALIAICCSCTSVGFFLKSKYRQFKGFIFKR